MKKDASTSHDSPLIIHNPGNKDGEYFNLDSLYMLTLEEFDASTQTLNHAMTTPGYYLARSGVVSDEHLPDMRPLHRHAFLELMYVCKGEVTQYIEDFCCVYKEGECCILNKNVMHVEAYSSDFEAVFLLISDTFISDIIGGDYYYSNYYNFHVPPNCVYRELKRLQEERTAFKKEYLDFVPVKDTAQICEKVEELFANILLETRNQKPGFLHIVSGYLARLFTLLSDTALYQMNCVDLKSSREDYIFNRVKLYLRKHHGRVDYDELENLMHYTRDYLNRVIKRHSGMTLVELGQSICLTEAAKLLTETDKNISEIVHELNYTNRTYFYRIFKEKYGMTPREYRNK